MENLLKQKSLSITPFRTEVLTIISESLHAVSVSYIEDELSSYNRITLYRTIKTFVASGLIHEIAISGKETAYALCKENCKADHHHHQHIHFSCNTCDEIFCVESSRFPEVTLPNFQIKSLEIQASGICQNCSEN